MKKIFTTLLLCMSLFGSDKLFYFTETKGDFSYVGVKDELGNILIPAQMYNYRGFKDDRVVKDKILSFFGCPKSIKRYEHTAGCVFDRKGKFLYQTFLYDNGPDYFKEGYQRIVKEDKIGFANRHGEIVIMPKHNFASPFNYGYATFCNGCHWEKMDDEHSAIVGGRWGVMNFKGEEVLPLKVKPSKKDVKINGTYYPYPFTYAKEEQNILSFFKKREAILKKVLYKSYKDINEDEKVLYFEIVERPSGNFEYYVVNAYNYAKIFQNKFFISKDGNKVFQEDFFGEKISFDKWLAKELNE